MWDIHRYPRIAPNMPAETTEFQDKMCVFVASRIWEPREEGAF